MSNNFLYQTRNNLWDETRILDMNRPGDDKQVDASRLYVHLTCDATGIVSGGDLQLYICPENDPNTGVGILPGRLEIDIVHGEFGDSNVIIENNNPAGDFDDTRIWYNTIDVTDQIVELAYDVNPAEDYITGYIRLFKGKLLGRDEVSTFTLG
jgi:hypothetical protein